MSNPIASLDALHDIRRMMQRSSRFLSLSGFSGIAAGLWALAGALVAHQWIHDYYIRFQQSGYSGAHFQQLKWNLVLLSAGVLAGALLSAFYFTWRKASREHTPLWDRSARLLAGSMLVPLATGGLLIAILLLQADEWRLVVPLALVFYGLALVSGSRFTHSDLRYLGYCELVLGLLSTQAPRYGIYFWAVGFGVLHILYGAIMWWKYDRAAAQPSLAH